MGGGDSRGLAGEAELTSVAIFSGYKSKDDYEMRDRREERVIRQWDWEKAPSGDEESGEGAETSFVYGCRQFGDVVLDKRR